MNKLLVTLVFVLIGILTCTAKAETPVSDTYTPDPNITSSEQDTMILNQLYYNGRVWAGRYYEVFGTEFMINEDWIRADVTANGNLFKDVEVKYDIYTDELITNYYSKRIIILNTEIIDRFTLYIGEDKLNFENFRGDYDLEGFHHVIYNGESKLYKKWYKKRAQFAIEAKYDEFQQDDELILIINGKSHDLLGRRNLFKILDDKKDEIRAYLKSEKIRIDLKDPKTIIPLLKFYDTL